MMTMFRHLTTYLMGEEEGEGVSPPGTATATATVDLDLANSDDQIDDGDWIFIENNGSESGCVDSTGLGSPDPTTSNDPPSQQLENKENNQVVEWENRLIEHPSMSVYVGSTTEQPEDDQSNSISAPAVANPTTTTAKRSKHNTNRQPTIVDYLAGKKPFTLQQPNRNTAVPYKKQQPNTNHPTRRSTKYKNNARVNNDRKCGCRGYGV